MNIAWNKKDKRTFEIMLIIVVLGMAFLLCRVGGFKMVVLNLFFLPIVLSGYFLGRTYAGILAVFSVLAVTVAISLDATGFAAFSTPAMIGLAMTIWGAVLGLTAILVGTLCDERARSLEELHAAYVGVVEVLSRYLQSADPHTKARSIRIAEFSQFVAEEMKLSRKLTDDIRVGALLFDLGNVEVTTKLLNNAVTTLEGKSGTTSHTFSGTELVHSLGSVLSGAMPLLLGQDDALSACAAVKTETDRETIPLGARIIAAVRAFDTLIDGDARDPQNMYEAVQQLRADVSANQDAMVLDAIERAVDRVVRSTHAEPVLA